MTERYRALLDASNELGTGQCRHLDDSMED
jgi:hypothetical protein